MSNLFFEKQDGMLCAQHALNMLLQGEYFTAVDLAGIAGRLDEQEKSCLSPEGLASWTSHNMDDTGFFSIQVLKAALKDAFHLDLVPLDAPQLVEIKKDPLLAQAFVCNMREHWFVLRQFDSGWFELNSTRDGPRPISNGYLDAYIAQLRAENYSIFYVDGDLSQYVRHHGNLDLEESDFDRQLRQAIELSKQEQNKAGSSAIPSAPSADPLDEEEMIRAAIEESLKDAPSCSDAPKPVDPEPLTEIEKLRKQRAAFLSQFD